ncbi:MAG TPA: helix-turn-helix domain-containing protein [bacterium]|nr:helix-turn-helix domain-containing protein [bacterium]
MADEGQEKSYPEEDLLDINGAAEYLSVSTKTVRRYIKSGKLRARKVRNVWFCPRVELDGLLDRGKSDEAPETIVAPSSEILDEFRGMFDEFKGLMKEIDRKLFLISQERENQIVRPDLIEKEQEIEYLKLDNQKLIEEMQRMKKQISEQSQSGPKDMSLLKSKSEEIELLNAKISSNERGLELLRQEIVKKDEIIRQKDETIREIKDFVRTYEEEMASGRGSRKGGFLAGRRQTGNPNNMNTGNTE